MRHVDASIIIDLVEQRLPQSERRLHEHHVADCRKCAAEYDFWWTFLSSLGPTQLIDAPAQLIDECIAIYGITKSSFSGFETARILFDSFLQPLPAAGLRGGAIESRQLIMRVEGLDVHIRISGGESNRTIQGQLLPLTASRLIDGAQIELRVAGYPAQFAFSNTLGEFRFNDVPAGSFSFVIDLLSEGRIAQFSVQGG